MAKNYLHTPHVTDSQPDVTGSSSQQGDTSAAEASPYWGPVLDQLRADTSRHLEQYLACTNPEVGVGESSALLNDTGLGCQYVDAASAAQRLQADLEALANLLIRMRSCAIISLKFMIWTWVFLTPIAILITSLTPLHKDECMSSSVCSILSTFVWVLPQMAALGAFLQLQHWYQVNRCRAKTDALLRKLAEGSLELRDKSRLTGRFSWRMIGRIRRSDIQQGSQEGAQQETSHV